MPNLTEITTGNLGHGVRPHAGIPPPPQVQKEMTIRDLWTVLRRRRWLILGTLGVVVVIAAAVCATATRMYKATAVIQVQKDSADALSLDNMMGNSSGAPDALDTNITLQTEAQVLQSETLAIEVIKTLKLDTTPDFRGKFSLFGWAMGLLAPKGIPDPQNVDLEDAPGRRSSALKIFQSHLKIKPMAGTRLIEVDFTSSDPRTASAVVNLLVENLLEYNFETRRGATQEASGWLTNQLADLRKQSEDLQAKVVSMQRDSGVFTDGQTDPQGREKVYTPVLDRLQQFTSQLAAAQSSRIMKGALYQVVKDGDPELISGLAGNGSLAGSAPGIAGSLTLLQNLRAQEAQTQAQFNELSSKFGPEYPKLEEIHASLASTQKAIRDESTRIAARAKNDFEVSQQIEDQQRAEFQKEKKQAETLNSKAVAYEITSQEATQSRALYESLLGRLKEADLVAGLRSSNITLVDKAHIPSRPSQPNILLFAVGGMAGGLLLGICAALFREATDSRIHDLSEMKELGQGGASILGYLPHHRGLDGPKVIAGFHRKPAFSLHASTTPDVGLGLPSSSNMLVISEPRAAYTEALRSLRTALMQSSHGGPPPQIILVTSSIFGEGKSTLSMNLATIYAQRGNRVLLVDTDLRNPTIQRRMELPSNGGLSSLLLNEGDLKAEPIQVSYNAKTIFHVMPGGAVPDYPTELLASKEMADLLRQWRRDYDFIILDSAPLLAVTDSILLTPYADFTLVVAREGVTNRQSLERTCEMLRFHGTPNPGIVLNGVKEGDAYSYYGYHQNRYHGGEVNA